MKTKMTRVVMASFRDAENKKYKLYRDDEEPDLWTVVTGESVLFHGTSDELVAYCDGAGIEFDTTDVNYTSPVEAVEAVEAISEEAESIPVTVADEEVGPIVIGPVEVTEELSEAIEASSEEPSVNSNRPETFTAEMIDNGVIVNTPESVSVESFEYTEATKETLEKAREAESKASKALAEIAALEAKIAELKK